MPEYRHQLQTPAHVSEWCQQDWTHKDKDLAYSDVNEWVGLDGVKYMVTRVGLWKHETCLSLLQWSVVIHRCWVSDLDSLVTLLLNCRRCQPATSALLTLTDLLSHVACVSPQVVIGLCFSIHWYCKHAFYSAGIVCQCNRPDVF